MSKIASDRIKEDQLHRPPAPPLPPPIGLGEHPMSGGVGKINWRKFWQALIFELLIIVVIVGWSWMMTFHEEIILKATIVVVIGVIVVFLALMWSKEKMP